MGSNRLRPPRRRIADRTVCVTVWRRNKQPESPIGPIKVHYCSSRGNLDVPRKWWTRLITIFGPIQHTTNTRLFRFHFRRAWTNYIGRYCGMPTKLDEPQNYPLIDPRLSHLFLVFEVFFYEVSFHGISALRSFVLYPPVFHLQQSSRSSREQWLIDRSPSEHRWNATSWTNCKSRNLSPHHSFSSFSNLWDLSISL